VLVPGGRACINLANLGRKPYIPLHSFVIHDMLDLGFLMRGEIIGIGCPASSSTAWGSWRSSSTDLAMCTNTSWSFPRVISSRMAARTRHDEFLNSQNRFGGSSPNQPARLAIRHLFRSSCPIALSSCTLFQTRSCWIRSWARVRLPSRR
jgi:hypothetical protein